MRQIVMHLMMVGLLLQVGCDNVEQHSDSPRSSNSDATTLPTEVSPLEMMSNKPDEPAVDFAFTIPTSNVAHPIAGRSAFPEPGEDLRQLITPKKLSEADQFAEPIDPDDIPDVVPWTEAGKYVGYEITVQGQIVDTGQSRDGKVNFLNFHKDWRGKFYMVVFDDLAKTLDKSVEQTFMNKTLRVKGMVEDHRGRPQIKILSMDQVQFVGE